MRLSAAAAVAAVVGLGALACGGDGAAEGAPTGVGQPGDRFNAESALRDLKAQVRFGPRPAGSKANREMTKFLADRLEAAGVERVRIQRPHRNVIGVIPGNEPGAIVIGAHHDTKNAISPKFEGANDGASGVAVVLELARALPDRMEGPSLHIALFDAEEARGDKPFGEDGTRGSQQYVRYAKADQRHGSPPIGQIHAMVLYDMVGDCELQIPLEANSDSGLYGLFAEGADEIAGDPAPFEGNAPPIDDDHVPFLEAGIAAVDLIDFTFGPGPTPGEWWHTPEDTLDKVCASSLDLVGEASVRAIPRIP